MELRKKKLVQKCSSKPEKTGSLILAKIKVRLTLGQKPCIVNCAFPPVFQQR